MNIWLTCIAYSITAATCMKVGWQGGEQAAAGQTHMHTCAQGRCLPGAGAQRRALHGPGGATSSVPPEQARPAGPPLPADPPPQTIATIACNLPVGAG